jgi:hypothetical protein
MVAARAAFELHEALVRSNNMHLHRVSQRRPDQEMAAADIEASRTERDIEIHNHLLYAGGTCQQPARDPRTSWVQKVCYPYGCALQEPVRRAQGTRHRHSM